MESISDISVGSPNSDDSDILCDASDTITDNEGSKKHCEKILKNEFDALAVKIKDRSVEKSCAVEPPTDTENPGNPAAENAQEPPEESQGEGYGLLFLLGLVEFLCGSALSILAPFYTSEATDHGLSVTASCIVFSTVFILQIVFTPLFGKYISKIGSVKLLVVGSVCSGLSNIGFGFVASIQTVEVFFAVSILMRAFTAIGESAINTAVYPLARSMANPKYSTTVLSCMETTFGLGTMLGPFFGGILFEYGGFFMPFLVCGVMLGLAGSMAGMLISCRNRRRRNEALKAGEATEVAPAPRIKFRKVIQRPGVQVAIVIVILSGMSSQWYQPTLEPFLYSNFKISAFKASLFLVIDGAVYAFMSPFCGILLDKRLSTRLLLMFGCTAISISFLLLGPFYFPNNPTLPQVAVSLAVHGLGMAANFIGTLTTLTREIEKGNGMNKEGAHGLSTSVWITAECIGSFIGSSLGGLVFENWGWTISCLIISVLQLSGLVLVLCNSLCMRCEGTQSEERKSILETKPNYGSNNNIIV